MHERDRRHERADRRGNRRYPLAATLAWRHPGSNDTHVGYTSDRSRSGVSFVTSNHHQPGEGEVVEMAGAEDSWDRLCVTRVTPYDVQLCLIACRCADPRLEPQRSRRAESFRHR